MSRRGTIQSRRGKVTRREFLKASAGAALLGAPALLGRAAAASEVRLSALAGGTTAIGLKAMEHQGFDKKNGFTGKFFYFSAAAAYQQFLGGNVDISIDTDPLVIAKARLKGHQITAFQGIIFHHSTILVKGDSPAKGLPDLKGKRLGHYGVDTGGGSTFLVLARLEHDLDFLKDFELRRADGPALIPLLDRGDIDAALLFDPLTSRAVKGMGAREVFGPFTKIWQKRTGEPLLLTVMTAKDEYIRKNLDLCRRAQRAWQETARWINANLDALRSAPFDKLTLVKDKPTADLMIERAGTIPWYTDRWDEGIRKGLERFMRSAAERKLVIESYPEGILTTLE